MERISVELPGVAPDDPLYQQKNDMLTQKGLTLVFSVAVDETLAQCELHFDAMLKAARVLTLNEMECYFLEVEDCGPISFTNELRSLHFLLTALDCLKHAKDKSTSLDIMVEITLQKLEHLEVNETIRPGIACNDDKEKRLLEWAQREGIMNKLDVAVFDGFGRGGRAAVDIAVNDIVLKIPQRLIICEDMVLDTDMHLVLNDLKDVSGETKVLLWSMRERHDPYSKFAPYFTSLPDSFNTGLSFGVSALKALDGTLVFEEILQAKEHLRSEYSKLFPALSEMYPSVFPENVFTWDMFLWACELWYSNGLKIAFPDGTIKTCLVPVAGLLNHSLYPHIIHYSKIDSEDAALILRSARPCKVGYQCFLNYGTFPNSHFLMFYGFTLGKENPFDVVPIDLDLSDALYQLELIERWKLGLSHMIRGCQFSTSQRSPYGIPSRLLSTLCIAFMDEEEARSLSSGPQHINASSESEVKAYEILLSILSGLLDPLGECASNEDAEQYTWDARLATAFKNQQRQLLHSACECCSLALKSLCS